MFLRRANFFRHVHRPQAERLDLPQRVGTAASIKHALGNLAVGLQRAI